VLCSIASAAEAGSQGLLNAGGRKHVLKSVVALLGHFDNETRYIVLVTGQNLSKELLAQIEKEEAEESIDSLLDQPYLRAVFLESGELRSLAGKGGGLNFFTQQKPLEGSAKIEKDRIKGEVKLVQTGDFAKEAILTFDVQIGASSSSNPVKLDPPVTASVKGKFTGDGKEGNLKFVSVQMTEPFSDKEAIEVIFAEQDHRKSSRPGFDAGFRKFGNALILKMFTIDGGIFGCEVAHSAHDKSPFSSVGSIKMQEFDLSGGNLKGRVTTDGVADAIGQKWEVDLTFAAPLPKKMRQAMLQPKAKETKEKDEDSDPKSKSSPKMKKSAPGIAAKSLPLPNGAKNVEYKALVEQIVFESNQPVRDVANSFSEKLAEQGWKESSGSLIGPKNAILRREHGEADLTIMIQPKGTGSVVKIFAKGLDWTGAEKSKKKAAPTDDLDNETKNLIEKALDGDESGVDKATKDLIEKALQGNE
jgi:hypothetical protein